MSYKWHCLLFPLKHVLSSQSSFLKPNIHWLKWAIFNIFLNFISLNIGLETASKRKKKKRAWLIKIIPNCKIHKINYTAPVKPAWILYSVLVPTIRERLGLAGAGQEGDQRAEEPALWGTTDGLSPGVDRAQRDLITVFQYLKGVYKKNASAPSPPFFSRKIICLKIPAFV